MSETAASKQRGVEILARLERWGAARDWIGPDPYEGLNSPLGRLARTRRGRQAVIQLYKRLPWRPPWPMHAASSPNAKALALTLAGYATPAGRELPGASRYLEELPARLAELGLKRGGWGYHFETQTRNIRYPADMPNAIATSFVIDALVDAHHATGEGRCAELALSARPFLLSLRHNSSAGPYFAYVEPGSDLVHNANLLVCGALARLHALDAEDGVAEAVCEAAQTTIAQQRPDGLWLYADAPNMAWIDNFHTAYVLQGLSEIETAFGVGSVALERGARAWLDRFIETDGWARYFHDRHLPLETHCCASAIDVLCQPGVARHISDSRSVAQRILECAIRELWLPGAGRFAFRVSGRGLNRREFMRWTNAPMFRALCRLVSAQAESTAG
jgi:polysaccharide biosynthesis protein VpsJ